MSNAVIVRGVEIGSGRPKICIPVMGRSEAEVMTSAAAAKSCAPDIIEWRIDWLDPAEDMLCILKEVRSFFADTPLLITFRSKSEGGEQGLNAKDYVNLLERIIRSGDADLLDVELFTGDAEVTHLTETAHARGVFVIGSSHDFHCTVSGDEIRSRLLKMRQLGCDIAKVAMMPQTPQDVLTLLSATESVKREFPDLPLVTMSMGQLGVISRLSGEVFGSAMTFGSAGHASAPGQVPAQQLREILDLLHRA